MNVSTKELNRLSEMLKPFKSIPDLYIYNYYDCGFDLDICGLIITEFRSELYQYK